MKLYYLPFAAILALTACGSTPPDPSDDETVGLPTTIYGTFVGAGVQAENLLAKEAMVLLRSIYPAPAHELIFQQRISAEDGFGRALLHEVERSGYRFANQPGSDAGTLPCSKKIDGNTFEAIPLCYLVDDVGGMLRLSLFVPGKAWSRLYSESNGIISPMGAWTQRSEN